MSTQSSIEWTEHTWNPITGCTKISTGCLNCYAEVMAKRLKAMKTPGYENGFKVTLHPLRLEQPIKRKKATIYFVNSMSDLFHEDVPDEFIDSVFSTILQTPHHTYQILTKRAERLAKYFSSRKCPQNAWLGVSVEDEHTKNRIDYLREIDVAVRFISFEPLLGFVGCVNLNSINWVIVGGESGPKARPMLPQWAESIRYQCEEKLVPFFFKQWGGWGADGKRRAKKKNGRELLGKTWDSMPLVTYL